MEETLQELERPAADEAEAPSYQEHGDTDAVVQRTPSTVSFLQPPCSLRTVLRRSRRQQLAYVAYSRLPLLLLLLLLLLVMLMLVLLLLLPILLLLLLQQMSAHVRQAEVIWLFMPACMTRGCICMKL